MAESNDILKPFRSQHLPLLEEWLRQPHVARWYSRPEENLAWATSPAEGGAHAIIAANGLEVGYLRWQRVDRATLDELGLHEIPAGSVDADILLSTDGVGKSVGPAALRALTAELVRDPSVAVLGLTTELENTKAHRAFERAGFRIARQYEAPGLGLCHLMLLDLRTRRSDYPLAGRQLRRDEIERVWSIDRSELVEGAYALEAGELVPKPAYFDVRGWPPGEPEHYTPFLLAAFDRGAWTHALFDGETIVGAAILDSKRIGRSGDKLQLMFLHVSQAFRGAGLGRRLFALASDEARRRGARSLYISATPSQHTIDFYRSLGCVVTDDIDAELFALEPEDIHLECRLS